jgi:hypothetical protein
MGVAFVENLIAALGASALTGAAVWAWRAFLVPRRTKRRRRAVLGFDVDESEFAPTVIVESTAPTETSHYRRPTVGYGAVLATANVAQLIGVVRTKARRPGQLKVWMDTDQMATHALSEESQHAIVIGGPISNAETNRYLRWLNEGVRAGQIQLIPSELFPAEGRGGEGDPGSDAIRFDDEGRVPGRALIVDGASFRATLASQDAAVPVEMAALSGLSGTDYGLVIRGPARNRSGRLVVIAGVHTIGLAGASRYLVQLSAIERGVLVRQWQRFRRGNVRALDHLSQPGNEDMLLVIRTDFEHGVVAASRLVAAWRIQFIGP